MRARRSSTAASSRGSTACRSASSSTTHAERFYDEGEDFWPKRYAIWGRLVARQPDQIAYSIVDAKAVGRFMPSVFPPMAASSIRELATQLEPAARDSWRRPSPPSIAAVRPGSFDHAVLDDCRTDGLDAREDALGAARSTRRRSGAIRCGPGITFTYLGVKVDERAQRADDRRRARARTSTRPARSWPATSCGKGYIAGVGMTIGTVFGRIAGEEAARHAAR